MAGSGGGFEAFQVVIELEDAAGALGGDDVGAAFDDGLCSGLAEFVGDIGVFEAGDASAAAAGAGVGQFHEFYPGSGREFLTDGVFDLVVESEVAGVVHGDHEGISGADGTFLLSQEGCGGERRQGGVEAEARVVALQEHGGVRDAAGEFLSGEGVFAREGAVAGGAQGEHGHGAAGGEHFRVVGLRLFEGLAEAAELGGRAAAGLRAGQEHGIAARGEGADEAQRGFHVHEAAEAAGEQRHFACLRDVVRRHDAFGQNVEQRLSGERGHAAFSGRAAQGVRQVADAAASVQRKHPLKQRACAHHLAGELAAGQQGAGDHGLHGPLGPPAGRCIGVVDLGHKNTS